MFNFKQTLNIQNTPFEMKANLNIKEPKIQEFWLKNNIYSRLLKQNKDNKQWILHDGPPYANGNIHVGHSLNKILKDVIVRYHLLNGDYSPFIAGWDTHGLPIEHALTKKIKGYNALSIEQKREMCKVFAIKNVNNQLEQFKRLGLITDFKDIYLTLNSTYEYDQLNLFLKMVEKNLVYQDFKPVYWSWSSMSALAEAEIEYANIESYSIYVSFTINENKNIVQKGDQIIIWTTTPWTIPANLAVAVHPNLEYVKIKVDNEYYIVGKSRLNDLATILNWNNYSVISTFKGSELESVKYVNPLNNKINPIILAEYVSDSDGTGLVHNAPGFGLDDYYACKKYNINVFCPIDDHGKYDQSVEIDYLVGLFYENANPIIIEKLNNFHALLKECKITHSAAIDWRTKKPVMYRATKQWFVNISTLKEDLINQINQINFHSDANKKQLLSMIANRIEWCISRQRIWGVPIPIIFDENKRPIFDVELINHINEIIKNEGSNVWFIKPVEYFLTQKYLNIDHSNYTKEKDIMDVWFDSGSSYNVLKHYNLNYPADLYFEGSDQYRGWFNSSLICGVIQKGISPYKSLLSHGYTLDEKGFKMSKSLGNVVDPIQVCNKFGADVLRLWCTSVDFNEDVRISKTILTQSAEIYRRIRNSLFKFVLSNISDFDFNKDANYNFSDADNYIINQLVDNMKIINKAYQNYDFATIIKIINLHIIKLSGWYFDLIKDTLYCESKDNQARRAIQTVLYYLIKAYLYALAPIIPHTCEEVYQTNKLNEINDSIFLTHYFNLDNIKLKPVNQNYWNDFFILKDLVFVELEKIRKNQIINKNNQAKIIIKFKNKHNFDPKLLKKYFNVAIVEIIDTNTEKIEIIATNANYKRCERCWNYYEANQIDENKLCPRCANLLKNNYIK